MKMKKIRKKKHMEEAELVVLLERWKGINERREERGFVWV
jgi:hypothetical protein